MTVERYLAEADYVARKIPGILTQHGLQPCISRFVLTESEQGHTWLFVILAVTSPQSIEAYITADMLADLSRELNGLPVVASDSDGLRYSVLLNPSDLRNRFDRSG